jgi:ankyrin repeat protein
MGVMAHPDVVEAVTRGDAERLRALLAADPGAAAARDARGVSARMLALYHGHEDLARLLAGQGGPLDPFEAAALGDVPSLGEALARDPGRVRSRSADGFTPLHFAAFFGRGAAARVLLDAGADPDAVAANAMKVTPLHSAIAARHGAIAVELIARGASPNVRQEQGWTPLHSAARNGDAEIVEALLRAGADPSAANAAGVTPAALAREAGHEAIVRRLEAGR